MGAVNAIKLQELRLSRERI